MAQKLIQTQQQKMQQVQRLSQQQLLQVRLLEMPLTELEQNVMSEIYDNPALDTITNDKKPESSQDNPDDLSYNEDDNFDTKKEKEDREEALEAALQNIGRDDDMPTARNTEGYANAEYEEIVYGDTISFYDKLKEQMVEHNFNENEKIVLEYLIGSLDNDGLLRKSLDDISDELAIYHSTDIEGEKIEEILKILQTFDPPGIGARSLQECLILQEQRKEYSKCKELTLKVLTKHFETFKKKNWEKIKNSLNISIQDIENIRKEIKKLNPKPGAALGEAVGRNLQQITPDFIIDTDENGNVSFQLNKGDIPSLCISQTYKDLVEKYKNNKNSMNKREKETLLYAKQKVDRAQGYIMAIKQRQNTLFTTMKAIIQWQKKYFIDGDEAELKPMILKDIAEKTNLDISTISRVSNIKYAQTKWGTFPLRYFFTDAYTTQEGKELSTRKIKIALKEIIDKENKNMPYSDDALKEIMKNKGFPIARRTIAKYREQMNIPVARLRKE